MQSLGTSAKLVLLLLFDALVPIAGLLHRVMAPGREQVKCLMSIHWASDSSNWYSDIQIDRYTDNIWYTDITDTYEYIYIHIIVNIYIYTYQIQTCRADTTLSFHAQSRLPPISCSTQQWKDLAALAQKGKDKEHAPATFPQRECICM